MDSSKPLEEFQYTMGFEEFVFQLHHLSCHDTASQDDYGEKREVMVQGWLWGGHTFLADPPPSDSNWHKIFESSHVRVGHSGSIRFADRFSMGLKLHPLYSDHTDLPRSNVDLAGPSSVHPLETCEVAGAFRRRRDDEAQLVTTDGRALVFVDFSEAEFHETSAKLQLRLCICPSTGGQVLQAVSLQALPGDSQGEKHLTWTWATGATRLRSFEVERLLTMELRLPKDLPGGPSTVSTAGTGYAHNLQELFAAAHAAHPVSRLYAPQLWLKAAVFEAGELIAKIDEELVLPVSIAHFLQPLNCEAQQVQAPRGERLEVVVDGDVARISWLRVSTKVG